MKTLVVLLIFCALHVSESQLTKFDNDVFSKSLLESHEVSEECKVSYADFLDRLSRPGELITKDAQWALKSKSESRFRVQCMT